MQNRNELCQCESGKKYKKCCGKGSDPFQGDIIFSTKQIIDARNKRRFGTSEPKVIIVN